VVEETKAMVWRWIKARVKGLWHIGVECMTFNLSGADYEQLNTFSGANGRGEI